MAVPLLGTEGEDGGPPKPAQLSAFPVVSVRVLLCVLMGGGTLLGEFGTFWLQGDRKMVLE